MRNSDHYEIVAPPGADGMGEVHSARDTRLDREAAIVLAQEWLTIMPVIYVAERTTKSTQSR
ncbi:MAG: hypothetical protein ACREEM_30100 [Blastocatellia bacterium]